VCVVTLPIRPTNTVRSAVIRVDKSKINFKVSLGSNMARVKGQVKQSYHKGVLNTAFNIHRNIGSKNIINIHKRK